MSEDDYPPEHSLWQDKDATTAYSLPYIDTSQPTSSTPLPTSSAQKPEQQKIERSEIDQLLDHYKLGGIQRELKYDVSSKMTNGIIFFILGILCFIPIIFLVLNIGYFRGLFWTAFLGFGFLAYGINSITASLNNLGARMLTLNVCYYLCFQGIMLTKGLKVQAIRWDQVKAIQQIPQTHSSFPLEYVLYPLDESEPLILEQVCIRLKPVRLQIEQEITHRLLPISLQAYKAGQTLNFGPIDMMKQGLKQLEKADLLPWEKLGPVGESRGFLIIREKGTLSLWARIDIATILNLCVLWPLLEQARRDQYSRESQQSFLTKESLVNPSLAYIPTEQSEWQEYE